MGRTAPVLKQKKKKSVRTVPTKTKKKSVRTMKPKPIKKKSRRTKGPGEKYQIRGTRNKAPKEMLNMGGHMINPPDFCPNRKQFTGDKYGWVDWNLCRPEYCTYCPCERKKWADRATSEELNEEWEKCGVIYFIPFNDIYVKRGRRRK